MSQRTHVAGARAAHPTYAPRLVATEPSRPNHENRRHREDAFDRSDVRRTVGQRDDDPNTKLASSKQRGRCTQRRLMKITCNRTIIQCIFYGLVILTALSLLVLLLTRISRSRFRLVNLRKRYRQETVQEDPAATVHDDDTPTGEDLVWVAGLGWIEKKNIPVHHKEGLDVDQLPTAVDVVTSPLLDWGQFALFYDFNSVSDIRKDEKLALSRDIANALDKARRFHFEVRRYASSTESKIRVRVIGQKSIIKRDFPMIRQGYESAFGQDAFDFKAPNWLMSNEDKVLSTSLNSFDFDVLLCLSLSACSNKDDTFVEVFDNNAAVRVNRLPNLRGVLWSKQNFCTNIPRWLSKLISFPCWVIPDQEKAFLALAERTNGSRRWIAKPWTSGGGNGISILSSFEEVKLQFKLTKNLVVQPFLENPLLVNNRKLDLRVYVLVTSTSPLRGYVHERGLVRFAAHEYTNTARTSDEKVAGAIRSEFSSRGQFLTNTSVNKKESNATMADLTWPFDKLFEVLGKRKASAIKLAMDRAISMILLAVEDKFPSKVAPDGCTYHLLGFDVIIPSDSLDVKVIEVNGEPSFAAASANSKMGEHGQNDHYDTTKVHVARDVARLLLTRSSNGTTQEQEVNHLAALLDDAKHVDYVLELLREWRVLGSTEFRPIYPSPVAASYPSQDTFFMRILEAQNVDRAKVHTKLNTWTYDMLTRCYIQKTHCQGGLRSVLDDLEAEGLRFETVTDKRDNGIELNGTDVVAVTT